MDLDLGENTFQVRVTSADRNEMETYTVTVTRAYPALVTNRGAALNAMVAPSATVGQAFTTGGNPSGYRVSSATIRLGATDAASDADTFATLWSDDAGPSAQLAALATPALTADAANAFAAPARLFLDPDTTYHLLVNQGVPAGGRVRVRVTDDDAETSDHGFSIADHLRVSNDAQPTVWGTLTQSVSMSVEGEALPACEVDLDGRTEIWAAELTVGGVWYGIPPVGSPLGYGYDSAGGGGAELSDAEFDFGTATGLVVQGVMVSDEAHPGFGAGVLSFVHADRLPASDFPALRLHVCGDAFDLADATGAAGVRRWENAGLDWSGAYKLSVALSASGDATLVGLSLSEGALVPAFDPATLAYAATVPAATARITVAPTVAEPGALVAFLDADGAALADADDVTDGFQVDLADGANTIQVQVTSGDRQAVRTYTLSVARGRIERAALVSNLAETTRDVGHYTDYHAQSFRTGGAAEGYAVTEVGIELADLGSGGATVEIKEDDAGEPGALVAALANPATFAADAVNTFAASDGTTLKADTTYWLAINEAVSDGHAFARTLSAAETGEPGWTIGDNYVWRNTQDTGWNNGLGVVKIEVRGPGTNVATLRGLTLGGVAVPLEPGTTEYATLVENSVSRITVVPETSHTRAKVEYLDAGGDPLDDADTVADGFQVDLEPGENIFRVRVTSADATVMETYTLTVTRAYPALVTNRDAALNASVLLTQTVAQAFTTGSNPSGYRVGSATVRLGATTGASDADTFATLWSHDGGPFEQVAALATPALAAQAANAFAAPARLFLDPDTTYHLLVNHGLAVGRVEVRVTDDDAETSDHGFSIADHLRVSNDAQPTVWGTLTQSVSMSVEGEALPACEVDLDGRTEIWAAELTTEALWEGPQLGPPRFYGYSGNGGALSDAEFDFGAGTGLSVFGLYVSTDAAPTGAGVLTLTHTLSLPASDYPALRLHVCGDAFDLADADGTGSDFQRWGQTGLDWSGAYKLSVALSASADATLAGLALGEGALVPAFDPATLAYAATVPAATARITVAPTVAERGALVAFLDGEGTALADADDVADGFQVDLADGANTVQVQVTAGDRQAVRTYVLEVLHRDVLAEHEVAADWSLRPAAVAAGGRFRLLFASSTKRDATSADIADYNTHVRTAAGAGHADIQAYADGFTAVGSTATVNARVNTFTTADDTDAAIYWINLSSTAVADGYADFWDGTWGVVSGRDESGSSFALSSTPVWTGTNLDGATATNQALGDSTASLRSWGASGSTLTVGSTTRTINRSLLALSPIFRVATETAANTAPVFGEGASTTRKVDENTAAGEPVGAPVAAVDADGDTLSYSLEGADAASFALDAATGQLSTSAPLDFETNAGHAVTVKADDGKGGTATIAVTVEVGDLDERPVLSKKSLNPPEGGSESYTVELSTRPTGNVTVTIAGYVDTDVTPDKTSLTFTTTDWDEAQMVTVSAGQDDDADDDKATLTHTASGGSYEPSTAKADLPVTVTDNDAPGLVLSPSSLGVAEGASESYTVALATQPTGNVTVTITGYVDTDVTPDETNLTFTTVNWHEAQTVTVSADQDDDAEDDRETLTHTAAGGGYGSVAKDLVVTVDDDDTAALVLTPPSLGVTEGATEEYTVALATQPTGDVKVTITGYVDTDVTPDETSLTFTTVTWNQAQRVEVEASEDDDAANDAATLTHTASGGGYDDVAKDLVVTVTDNDTPGLVLSPSSLGVTEGATEEY
ncbi:MAG: cadherin-like beta sandwich domain-containing protein, partial [Acidobacteriota bacterium]|nr:cadherin-like beta sandwich domain-containing protein [Acidobacteriota bacterium]